MKALSNWLYSLLTILLVYTLLTESLKVSPNESQIETPSATTDDFSESRKALCNLTERCSMKMDYGRTVLREMWSSKMTTAMSWRKRSSWWCVETACVSQTGDFYLSVGYGVLTVSRMHFSHSEFCSKIVMIIFSRAVRAVKRGAE